MYRPATHQHNKTLSRQHNPKQKWLLYLVDQKKQYLSFTFGQASKANDFFHFCASRSYGTQKNPRQSWTLRVLIHTQTRSPQTYIHTHVFIQTNTYIQEHTHITKCVHICTYIHREFCSHTYTHPYILILAQRHINIRPHTCTHTHMHTWNRLMLTHTFNNIHNACTYLYMHPLMFTPTHTFTDTLTHHSLAALLSDEYWMSLCPSHSIPSLPQTRQETVQEEATVA